MTQVVVISLGDKTFTATCESCGTTFAGRLDDDLEDGVFLCRSGHHITIVRRDEPPAEAAAVA